MKNRIQSSIFKILPAKSCWIIIITANAILCPFAHAASVIDQQQPFIDRTVGGLAIGNGPFSEQMLAQTVRTGITGLLTELRLPVSRTFGDLIVEIQGVSDELPNGQVLASESFTDSSFRNLPEAASGFTRLPFSNPVALSENDIFAIVLSSTGTFGLLRGPVGDLYPDGSGFFDARPNPPGVWVPFLSGRDDLVFQTVVEPGAIEPIEPPVLEISEPTSLMLFVFALTIVSFTKLWE